MNSKSQHGSVRELVIGLVALAVAVTALVVALTRNPHASKVVAIRPSTSTTLETPKVSPAGTITTNNAGTILQVIGLVRIPIDHVGRYSWTGPVLTIPAAALEPNGLPEHMASSYRIDGTATLLRATQVLPVEDLRHTRRSAFRVTFTVTAFTGKPDVLITGANISTVHNYPPSGS